MFFSKKNVLRFLSLRYSTDFRRSRLVSLNKINKKNMKNLEDKYPSIPLALKLVNPLSAYLTFVT